MRGLAFDMRAAASRRSLIVDVPSMEGLGAGFIASGLKRSPKLFRWVFGELGQCISDLEPRRLGRGVNVNDRADDWIIIEAPGRNDDVSAFFFEHRHVRAADSAERSDVAR